MMEAKGFDSAIRGVVSAAGQAFVRKGEDYAENGIVYCGKCRTPKQCRVPLFGEVSVVPCMCECEKERYKREQREVEENAKRVEIEQNRTSGIQDVAMRKFRFDAESVVKTESLRKCKRYADAFPEAYKRGAGLLLYGDVGTGKSYAAGCIANQLVECNISVLCTSFPRILNELQGMRDGRNEYLHSINRYKLLVIDDLGAERESDYALEQVFYVIDERVKSKKPMIVTTNLNPHELINPKNVEYSRIYDRILGVCAPILFSGMNFRKENANETRRYFRALFEDENGEGKT